MKAFTKLLIILIPIIFLACERSLSTNPGDNQLPIDSLLVFREAFDSPEECASCHPNHYAEWQTSMHAYAFVDPIFFRLNDIGQNRSNQQLDQFCVKCHSPIASLLQETPPGFEPSLLSSISQKGVQCDVCHMIDSFDRGRGIASFRLDKIRQGPITDSRANSFHASEFDKRYNKSKICAPCHDVFSPDDIQVEFTSTEWDNSPYAGMGLECQGCHMPAYAGQAALGGPERTVHRHTFVGVDIPLADFPGRQQTIAMVDELLNNSVTMEVSAPVQISSNEDITVRVKISNDKTGHNIPTGTIFERQMWLEIILKNPMTDAVIYSSGTLDANGDLLNHHSDFVKAGSLPEDKDLALFHGIPYKNGQEILFFWEADFIDDHTIPPFASKTVTYNIPGSFEAATLELQVRLRFRSFAPYFLRAIEQENLIDEVLIFDMEEFAQQIAVTN